VATNPLRLDPTRTATLRRVFAQKMNGKVRALRQAIWKLIVEEDALGLGPSPSMKLDAVLNVRWEFESDAQKVKEFRTWLKQQVDAGLLETNNRDEPWTDEYVHSAHKKGVIRAYNDAKQANMVTDDTGVFEGTRDQFLMDAFNSPQTVRRLELLKTRAFTQLEGITDTMSSQLGTILADGLANGHGARKIARNIHKSIGAISKKRAMVLARTEIIHAYAEGQLDAFERLGVDELGIMAEWLTAWDDKVCPLCAELSGVVMRVEEARGLLPRHPNCRCAWKPANVGESRTRLGMREDGTVGPLTQRRSQHSVQKHVDASVKRERKRKRTLAEARDQSTWKGADLKVKKEREPGPGRFEPAKPSKTVKPKPKPKPKPKKKKVAKKAPKKAAPAPKKKPTKKKGAIKKPKHISFSGKPDEFAEAVWKEVGDGLRDEEQTRAVGALIRSEVEKNPTVKKLKTASEKLSRLEVEMDNQPYRNAEWEKLYAEKRKTLLEVGATAKWEVNRNLDRAVASATRQTLKRVRNFGTTNKEFNVKGLKWYKKMLNNQRDDLPDDWVKKVADESKIHFNNRKRGFYRNDGKVWNENKTKKIRKSTLSVGSTEQDHTALHELVHAVEDRTRDGGTPPMGEIGTGKTGRLQAQFLRKRQKESTGFDAKVTEMSEGEWGLSDKFFTHYCGRNYSYDKNVFDESQHYEVLSMGIEATMKGKDGMIRDPDYYDFCVGVMAGL